MNGIEYVLDTNIVLYLLAGNTDLWTMLESTNPAVSVITEMELLSYQHITEAEESKIRKFLAKCVVVPLDNQVKDQAITFRKAYNLKLPDSIIVATAAAKDFTLLTADKRLSTVPDITCMLYTG